MSTKSAPFYWITCDAEGCGARCPSDEYDECVAYMTAEQAKDVADVSDWETNYAKRGRDYCPDHAPTCDCDLLETPQSPQPCAGFAASAGNSQFCGTCGHLEECH